MTRFQLFIHAENLPKSRFRRPDPYAIVRFGKPDQAEGDVTAEVGRTEVLPRTTDPEWSRILFVEAEAAKITYVTVSVYDHHNNHHLLGQGTFEVTEVNQSPGHFQEQPLLAKKAKLFLSVVQSSTGNSGTAAGPRGGAGGQGSLGGGDGASRMVTMQFRGLDIRNVEPGILGLGRSDPYLEIAKKNTDHNAGIVRWNVVHRTEAIQNHLNPFWKEFTKSLEELCDDNVHSPLLISVLDQNCGGKNRKIGEFETTVAQLKERVAVKGNADREMAFPLFTVEDGDTHGLICCLKVDFLDGGDAQSTGNVDV
jgi:Ca2+-dependent lipid-binding protein